MNTIQEAKDAAEKMARSIQESIQSYHDETGLIPMVLINSADVTSYQDTRQRLRYRVDVEVTLKAFNRGIPGG